MSDNETPETLHTCAVTGEEGPGKHYILRTTEGEELVSPDALFGSGNSDALERHVKKLQERVEKLEEERRQEQGDEHRKAAEQTPVAQAAKKTTAARKTTS
jgi:hypothetical protein